MMINVTLKDGVVKQYEQGTTAAEVAKSLGAGLYKAACAAKVDGKAVDLRTPLESDCTLSILTFDAPEGKHAFWHTASHVLAQAVMRLYPDTKYTIGPAVENGFYYDFDVEKPFTPEDLAAIEKEMAAIVKSGVELDRFELDAPQARELMKDQPYKLELIDKHAASGEKVSFYRHLRRSASDERRAAQGNQAAPKHRRLLAWRQQQQDALPRIRHCLPQGERVKRLSAHAGGGQAPGPPQAWARAGSI